MDKERVQNVEQRSELMAAAEMFLDLLYRYDYVGKEAYFKKRKKAEQGAFPIYDRSCYQVIVGRKYVWMDSPYLRLGITKEGDLFKPKKYWTFGHFVGGKIDAFLDPELWGTSIYRVHTRARRGIGRYESAIMDYHDLHLSLPA